MTLTVPGFILLILIAAICGAFGRALAGGPRHGLIVSIALGFVGALVGPLVAHEFGLSDPLAFQFSGQSFPIVWASAGAVLVVACLHVLTDARVGRKPLAAQRQTRSHVGVAN